jgi:hypothetical protein
MHATWRIAIFGGLLAGGGCGGPQPPPFRPVVDTKLLMQAVVDPAADAVWEATGWIITADGIQQRQPKDAEAWTVVRNQAVALTEAGNLLMMAPRAKDGGEWMKRAAEMIAQGEAAIHAAEARDWDKLFSVGGDIYEACSACHEGYLDAIVSANK